MEISGCANIAKLVAREFHAKKRERIDISKTIDSIFEANIINGFIENLADFEEIFSADFTYPTAVFPLLKK